MVMVLKTASVFLDARDEFHHTVASQRFEARSHLPQESGAIVEFIGSDGEDTQDATHAHQMYLPLTAVQTRNPSQHTVRPSSYLPFLRLDISLPPSAPSRALHACNFETSSYCTSSSSIRSEVLTRSVFGVFLFSRCSMIQYGSTRRTHALDINK